jgi:hypothetical protein
MITEHEKLIERLTNLRAKIVGDQGPLCPMDRLRLFAEEPCDWELGADDAEALVDLLDNLGHATKEAAAALSQLDATRAERDACRQQAEQWKMEAMGHKSSLHEAYQVLTDATGEPGNWNGARPFRDFLQADREVFGEWLRGWVKHRFGKWITHETAASGYFAFDLKRRDRARQALAALKHQGAET